MLNRMALASSLAILSGLMYLLATACGFSSMRSSLARICVAPSSRAVVYGIRRHQGRGDCEWLGVRLLLGRALQSAFALPELRRCERLLGITATSSQPELVAACLSIADERDRWFRRSWSSVAPR